MTAADRTGSATGMPHTLQRAAHLVVVVAFLSVFAIGVDGAVGLPVPEASLLVGCACGGLLAGMLEIGAGLSALNG